MVVPFPVSVSCGETLGRRQTHRCPWAGQERTPVWQISSGLPSLSRTCASTPATTAGIRELEQLLDERFAIDHTTLQVDHAAEPDLRAVCVADVRV
jgi:hypothetical protein